MLDRRTFIKSLAALGVAGVMPQSLKAGVGLGDEAMPLLTVNNNALRITGTFLDEISHDIPHQNWGEKEWDADFRHMKSIGIDTVIGIRSGYRKFITYSSLSCLLPSLLVKVNRFEREFDQLGSRQFLENLVRLLERLAQPEDVCNGWIGFLNELDALMALVA